jgi:hypothetical protein
MIQTFLSYLNIILTIGLVFGGVLAFRRGFFKEVDERQKGLIGTLKDEVDTLRGKVDDLEKERATQDRVIATIRYALRQYNLKITIAGGYVTLDDSAGKSTTSRVQTYTQPKPIMPTSDDDNDAV